MAESISGNGRASTEGTGEVRPPSRLREITSRGVPKTPEEMFAMSIAGSVDVVNEALDRRDVTVMCRGLQTAVSIARNSEPLGHMCDRLAAATERSQAEQAEREEASRVRRMAQLRAEMDELEEQQTRPVPRKG